MKLTRTFTKGIMNKDLDERLIPPGQYRDGQNIGVSTSEDSNVGSIENMLGNTQVGGDLSYLSSSAKTIGAISDDARETFYWFVTDTSFDYILKYNETTGIASKVLEDTKGRVLKFDSEYIITGISIVDNLLFWTDNLNPPRRLNIKKFYALDAFTEDDISVIVKPPLTRPVISLELADSEVNLSQQSNNIEDKFLRFAYRWRYENNEYSSLSPFSSTAFSPGDYKYNYQNAEFESMLNQFNQISIDLSTGESQVTDIQLVVTNELTSAVYIVETYNKEGNNYSDNSTVNVLFNNNKIYNLLAADEVTRLFDNVPLKAQAQAIVGSRLLYGNYVQFFDIVDSFNTPINIDFTVSLESLDVSPGSSMPTFKSNRDYEVGIAYLDEYGRMTTPLIPTLNNSQYSNTIYIPTNQAITSNDLRISINNNPPVFANKYRIFLKESNKPYDNIFPLFYYVASSKVYFYIDRSDVNKVKEGDYIIVKVVGSEPTLKKDEYKVLEVEVKEKGFLGNNEAEGLYFSISDPNGDFTRDNLFQDSFEGRGFWNGMGEFAGSTSIGGAVQVTDIEPFINPVSQIDVPIFYGKSTTNQTLTLVANHSSQSSPYDPVGNPNTDSRRYKITVISATAYKLEEMSGAGGYTTSSVSETISYSSSSPNSLPKGLTSAFPLGYFYFSDGAGYKIGDSWVINFHSRTLPGSGGSVINPNMPMQHYQTNRIEDFAQQPEVGCRIAILPGNIPDTWNLDNDPSTPVNSSANFVDREIKQGSILDFTIYEQVVSRGFLQGSGSNNLADLVYAESPISQQQFIASRDYKNIEEWFYEDEVYLNWDHINAFNAQQQRGSSLRVMFKRGLWNDPSDPANSNPDFWWQYNLNFASNWTNQMYQRGNTAIPTFGNYPDWASFLTQRAPVRMCIVASANSNPSDTWNTNPELVNIITNLSITIPEEGNPVFETKPKEADVDIFYETPFTFNITNGVHEGNVQNQSNIDGGAPAIVSLNTATLSNATTNDIQNAEYNSYCFGNGVESMRIRGDWNASVLKYSPRASTPIDDYGQERLGASLTYSGIYRENSTVNNLNEFNLSLANFKDIQVEYGPVRKLHARDADVVVFQEDKVSKVLYGKNLLSDSVGGGNVASIPQVLGTQITYVGEYGISENPESFASWGNNMYFTDAKRGAILQLGLNGIFEISQLGMSDYFKDLFRDNLTTQKLGAIDPFKEQYVLSSNSISAPPCNFIITPNTTGRFGSSLSTSTVDVKSSKAWAVELLDTGDGNNWVTINGSNPSYSGYGNETINIKVLTNSGTQRQLNFRITGCDNTPITIPFIQSAQKPLTIDVIGIGSTADANINLNTNSSYTFTNSAVGNIDFNNQKIIQNNQPFLDNVFEDIEGYQAVPKSGDTVTLKAPQTGAVNRKSFDPTMGTKMYYLVSNTRYNQSQIDNLLNDSSTVEITPTLSAGNFEGGFTFSRPSDEKYLYLVYDYRSKQTSGNRFIVPAATNNVAGTFNGIMELGTKVGRCDLNYLPSTATGNIYTIKQGDTIIATTGTTPVTTSGTLSFVKKSSTVTTYDIEIQYYGDNQQFEASVPTPTLTSFNFDTADESLDPGNALYVCRSTATPPTGTKYHDGASALPVEGDIIYETPNGNPLNLNDAVHRVGTTAYPGMNWVSGGANGVVLNAGACTACAETVVPSYTGPTTIAVALNAPLNIKLQTTNNPTSYSYASNCTSYFLQGGAEGGTVSITSCEGLASTLLISIEANVPVSSSTTPVVVSGTVTVLNVGKATNAILPAGLDLNTSTGVITGSINSLGTYPLSLIPSNCFGQGASFTINFQSVSAKTKVFEMDASQIKTTHADSCVIPAGQLNPTLFFFTGKGVDFPIVNDKIFTNDKVVGVNPFNGGYQYYKVEWGGTNGSTLLIDARGTVIEVTACP